MLSSCYAVQVLKDSKFADARYLRQMLLEVFTALDKAQRKFGFHRAHAQLYCVFSLVCLSPDEALCTDH